VRTYDEATETELFIAELFGEVVPRSRQLRRVRRHSIPPLDEWTAEAAEIVEVPGFFGPNNVRRSEQEIRAAVVARVNAEWTSWHTSAGAPRAEGEVGMFGRLVGYYLAAVARIKPDTLTAIQATALGANYAALLAATATAAAVAAETARLATVLVTGSPDAADAALAGDVRTAIGHAREANRSSGSFSAWSAAFVTACVRGAAIAQGLEAAIAPGRQHVGRDELLLATLAHAEYTIEARRRRAATTPRRRGCYHAFEPRERPPQPGDIIVQDRRDTITAAQVTTLTALSGGITHGDIVVDVQPGFAVTVGGNVGDSARRRRYPRDDRGLLVVDRRQLFTQEDNSGALADVPVETRLPLAPRSTGRIFALLAPVEELAAVPGQPYGGGILT
jgi:hypothetical protein